MNRALRRSALTAALGLCFATNVHAQSNTAGAVFGQASAGDTVVVENPATGFKREIRVGNDGSYRASALPTGSYRVTLQRADGSTATRENVTVNVGTGTSVNFAAAAAPGATTLDAVQVTAAAMVNPIDVSSVESTTILTAEQIAKIPVPRDVTSVALLAPGTVKGDAAFGNLASFGGASVAENAYFVNGFNITNSFKGLNFATIPFEAIGEQQIKTGGYGAEFGRALGGVVNLITKRGTNEFHAGGNIFYTASSLRATERDIYSPDGQLISDNSRDRDPTETIVSAWASGALVKDTLFGYALVQYGRESGERSFGNNLSVANDSTTSKNPNWLVKLDWNINDANLLEFTAFSDKEESERDVYANPQGVSEREDFLGTVHDETGGDNYVLKYTGYLTDTFTLSALYGMGEYKRNNYAVNADGQRLAYDGRVSPDNATGIIGAAGCPVVTDGRPDAVAGLIPAYTSSCAFLTGSSDTARNLGLADARDKREQFRIDAEWQLGAHLLRFGYDTDTFKSRDGEASEGGVAWRYVTRRGEDMVRRRVFQTGADVEVDSEAFYIEDNWSITDNFIAYVGLRWDSFENKNGAGETYVKQDDQFGPRLGFSWDVNGDSSLKIFGNAGRYALPIAANVAVRGSSPSLYSQEYLYYDGVDPVTGAPVNPTATGDARDELSYLNNEFGTAKDPRTIASKNLDPQYQDEYILGFQKQLTDNFSGGVRGIYRELKRGIDDHCDYRVFEDWADENGYAIDSYNPAFTYCHIYNPGSDLDVQIDIDADGTLENVFIPADRLGPKARRTYTAVELFAEGQLTDRFFLQGSYTWSKNKGNAEGGVKSDIGQDDTGVTQDFDYPELMVGADGYLPNDRRHTLKLFGNYEFSDQWSVGANFLYQSGRPINCFGVYGDDPTGYGASYFSCDAGPVDPDTGSNGTTIVRRGSAGRTPDIWNLDLNVAYRPSFAEGRLALKMDVFNVFNRQKALAVDEFGEDSTGNPLFGITYLTPTVYQAPRAVRFMVQYDW
ncbi:TonB-dependent receptor [Lysobacter arvi]|uniref:TonB-dependent receptor n=1 Tax=Lysobacter arvi TaxID=3038776 RepID=A0ABU1CBW1_9GAMM|nr:TonB-dependent receptor [Lysobacter arvi]MDR0182652.1 TonB-dependent receptor [Lysobacter arvi]